MKRLQMNHHRSINAALARLGVSLAQWDALRHLHENPGASLHDLAGLTFQTDQSFGALAARMETRELIERVPGPGRAVRHRLTEQGDEIRRAGENVVEDVLRESFSPLTAAQRETFDELLRKLLYDPRATPASVGNSSPLG